MLYCSTVSIVPSRVPSCPQDGQIAVAIMRMIGAHLDLWRPAPPKDARAEPGEGSKVPSGDKSGLLHGMSCSYW